MKKIAFLAVALVIVVNTVHAQFYFRAGLGYAFPMAGQTIDGSGTPYSGTRSNSTYLTTYSIKNASFSSGVQGALALGYMFDQHIGLQLDVVTGIANTKYTFVDNNYGGYQEIATVTMQADAPLIITPSLVLQTGGKNWNIYSRLGLALPVSTSITLDELLYSPLYGETDDYKFRLKSSFGVGFAAAAGVEHKINDRIRVWCELSSLSLSVFLKQSDLLSVTQDGFSVPLSTVTGIAQTVTYSKNATVDSNYNHLATFSQPFSNMGINVGVTICFSGKSHRAGTDLIDDRPARQKIR